MIIYIKREVSVIICFDSIYMISSILECVDTYCYSISLI